MDVEPERTERRRPRGPLMNYSNIRLATDFFLSGVFINASSADLIGTCAGHENSFAFFHAEFATNIVKYTYYDAQNTHP